MPVFNKSQISIYDPSKNNLYLSQKNRDNQSSLEQSLQLSGRSIANTQNNLTKKLTSIQKLKKKKEFMKIECLDNFRKLKTKPNNHKFIKTLKSRKKGINSCQSTFSVSKNLSSVNVEKKHQQNKASIDFNRTGFDFKTCIKKTQVASELNDFDEDFEKSKI